ncbi:enoyl-CoA hydratase/isomerase family protein [Nocardia sp. NEAU-G5]|uniref:Enoyl-CoA hydratase/isomerase family protein n=1 Tax=Nocardia albiluteola TaxID=2842303 RepID=A0ABS6AYX6_9NOCA|nr:enoyl-CoA hydratase-related protein [Nocardia albiluteola]MBU3063068.1 enoyl-CoA hydratase/isomerase family protein [Nocardia albiluteola]
MIDITSDEIRYELDGHVARITIDRPHVLNAIDEKSHRRCNEIWTEIENDARVRAVVITGSGERAFCVGADMSTSGVGKTGVAYWADLDPNGFAGLSLRRSLDVPVIARVNGFALGGGMEIVLGADIVVAADTAQFGLTEPRVGRLPLDGGIVNLVRRIPHTQAMAMLLTGRRTTAAALRDAGLVNEVVPATELDAAVDRWLEDILACAPTSLRAIKQIINRTEHMTAADARATRLPALIEALESPNATEGVAAFQQKRRPVWSDR